jgi:DNA-binding LacI/PurR family transcriptional regulator
MRTETKYGKSRRLSGQQGRIPARPHTSGSGKCSSEGLQLMRKLSYPCWLLTRISYTMSRKTKPKQRLTSADVARASGVSRATVSYVLNKDPRQTIPAETRDRVLKAARTLGYQPFAPARSLRAGYSRLVLLVAQFEQVDPNVARDLHYLEAGLAEKGYSLIWHVGAHITAGFTHPSANLTPAAVISCANEKDPAIAAFLRQFGVPVLPMSTVASGEAVGRIQVTHLARKQGRRMVFAAPERRDVQRVAEARLDGVRQACAELGLEPPLVQVVPLLRSGSREAIGKILAYRAKQLGICCYNDEVAFAVLAALADAGISVPGSVAVIGCDDIPLAQFSIPALTTIAFDNRQFLDLLIENVLAASHNEPTREAPEISVSVVTRLSA